MLIETVNYYKTTVYLNPDCISRAEISKIDGSVILFLDGARDGLVINREEWERIKPMLVSEAGLLQSRYDAALRVVYTQAVHIQALETQIHELLEQVEKAQAPRSLSADEIDSLPTDDYGGF